jgi:hypothetical protein
MCYSVLLFDLQDSPRIHNGKWLNVHLCSWLSYPKRCFEASRLYIASCACVMLAEIPQLKSDR